MIALLRFAVFLLGFAPPEAAPEAPAGDEASEDITWLLSGPWGTLAVLIVLAVVVLMAGNMMTKMRGRGRARAGFDLEVARMENLTPTPIAELVSGPAHAVGVVSSTTGSLGGPPERARVYMNRAGSDRSTAVGSELIVVEDESGKVAVEDLESARVLAPREDAGPHEVISLYVGDRVQLLGRFKAEVHGEEESPEQRVYGMFGVDGQVQVKVLERAPKPETPEPDAPAEPPSEDETPAAEAEPPETRS